MKRRWILVGSGILFILVFVFWNLFITNQDTRNYPIKNDDCTNDEDCVYISNSTGCSCSFKAVNKQYFDYWKKTFEDRFAEDPSCELYCEIPLDSICVENRCSLVW